MDDFETELMQFAKDYPCNCANIYWAMEGHAQHHGPDCENDVVQEFVEQFIAQKGGGA